MAGSIRVVSETDVGEAGGVSLAQPLSSAAVSRETADPQIIAAFAAINGRLQAIEGAVQGIPQSVGLIRGLLRALGARVLMGLAMSGCLGLAGATAFWPSWQGLATFAAFSVLVYLPMAYLAAKGH